MHAQLLQLCLTLCDLRDFSLPGCSVHSIFQARILEWVAVLSSFFLTHRFNLCLLYLLHCRKVLYSWATSIIYIYTSQIAQLVNIYIYIFLCVNDCVTKACCTETENTAWVVWDFSNNLWSIKQKINYFTDTIQYNN